MQLLERVLQQVETEHRDGKRKRFSHLVAVAWTTGRDRPFEEKNRFMQALEEFDELHIGILSFLRQNDDAGTRASYAAIGDALCVPEEERDERLGPALDRLASGYGFLRRGWLGNALLKTNGLSPEGIARRCEHTITKAGVRFLEFVCD